MIHQAYCEPTYNPSLANMTIEEWTVSGKAENNWLTRTLVGDMESLDISQDHLELAQDIIQRKFVVGLTTEMGLSWKHFRQYFGWSNSTYKHSETCMDTMVTKGANSNKNKHNDIQKGSSEWGALASINQWWVIFLHSI